jgi:hypothetical protein
MIVKMGNQSSSQNEGSNDIYVPPTGISNHQNPKNPFDDSAYTIGSDNSTLDNTNSLLNANTVFKSYSNFKNYSSFFDVYSYFKNINDISINAEDAGLIATKAQDTTTNIINVPTIAYTGNSLHDDINITLSKTDTGEELVIYKLCKLIRDNILKEFNLEVKDGQLGDQITNDHYKMHHLMDSIVLTITTYYFNNVQNVLKQENKINSVIPINGTTDDTVKKMRRAAIIFSSLWDAQTQAIYNNISTLSTSFFDLAFSIEGELKDINDPKNLDFISSLGNGDLYNSTSYYMLRDVIARELNSPTASNAGCANILNNIRSSEGPDVSLYFTKLISDIYIKCSYPLLQYQFITSLMKEYMKKGDFVNTRLGLFAKIHFVLYLVSILSLVIQNYYQSGSLSSINDDEITSVASMLNDILYKLNKYLENMNKIDMASSDTTSDAEISKILQKLQEMSNNVQSESKDITIIQQSIESARLEIRNLIFNISIIKKKKTLRQVEFWIAFSILMIMLLSSITLLFMDMNKIVLYVVSTTILLVLLYKLVLMIIGLIKKH